ncbi:MAG: hypothetical protein GX861_01970 [Tenericutes bacterium]|jgi:hypothetical protein|nr:hypothetical protein [Mycoplasmatota bacterium]
MNVLVTNENRNLLANLEIELIKTMHGQYNSKEFTDVFTNFLFAKMVLDITAIKGYEDINVIRNIVMNIDADKIVLLLPLNNLKVANEVYYSKLVSIGLYNFATDVNQVKYLLNNPNSYRDVAKYQNIDPVVNINKQSNNHVIGLKNITDSAGATTLLYLMKKELTNNYHKRVLGIELGKRDLIYFNDQDMISISRSALSSEILKNRDYDIILVDLNETTDTEIFTDVLYLIEPSIIKLNKLMKRNPTIFNKLQGKKIVLNKSMLTTADVVDFAKEANVSVFYNVPPINDRSRSGIILSLIQKLGLVNKEQILDEKPKIGPFKF